MSGVDGDSTSVPSSRVGFRSAQGGGRDDATVISASADFAAAPRSSTEIGQRLQGTMLGPYRLDSFVGGGGMGAVFRALDTTLDRTVAVKVLAGGHADDEEMLRRFRNEAQSAARLDHENIGRVFAVGSDEGWHYIVFEFIEGQNLRDLVREHGAFSLGRTIDVAVQVADALEHASQRDVVHRDIKPSNIVITPADKARIVDMGLARLHHLDGGRDLTVSGVTLGTFDYISPEQARDSRTADVRSDLYSLGCTMFFMLTGRPPFADGSMVQKLLRHQQERPPAIESLRPDVPRAFGAILERLMEKDPADRYQRPAELVADLIAFAAAHGHPVSANRPATAAVPRSVVQRPAARLPWVVPLLGLAATVGVLWYRAATTRRMVDGGGAASPAAAAVADRPTVIRVGEAAAGASPDAAATAAEFAAAFDRAVDGDMVELAFSGPVDVPAIALRGRRLSLRALPGTRPALRFTSLVEAGIGLQAAWAVGTGGLTIEGVAVRLTAGVPSGHRAALFAVSSGSIACTDALLVMPGDPEAAAGEPTDAPPAFIAVAADGPGMDIDSVVTMRRAWVYGDATFLDATAVDGGRIALSWSGGGLLASRPLVEAAGARGGGSGVLIEAALADAVFACGAGLASLRDSPDRPLPARLRVEAGACDFLLAAEPLIVQRGTGEPSDYAASVSWRDQGSRYTGSDVLQRIDGAAERIEVLFRDQPAAMRHRPEAAVWPNPAVWEAAWEDGAG